MDTLVLTPLNTIETHLSALITTLTQTNNFTTAPQLAQSLLADDDNLTSALSLLQRHQQNYARILHLREEVSTLQEQLKDTIRKCVSFKNEIGEINASILEEESEDEGEDDEDFEEKSVAEVDYHTLLTFAARTGKHNTLAANEAAAEGVRRRIAAKHASSIAGTVNGTQTTEILATQDTTITTATGQDTQPADNEQNTAETTAELARISALIALERARMGMSFPDGATLRLGALGSLQLFREQAQSAQTMSSGSAQGEDGVRAVDDAVEREIGRLVRESETGIVDEEIVAEEEEEVPFPESPVLGRRDGGQAGLQSQAQTQRPVKPKVGLDLDFPDSDDEDDD